MVWTIIEDRLGLQPIDAISDVQVNQLGTRIRARSNDAALGEGEFIYVKSITALAIGEALIYNSAGTMLARTNTTTRGAVGIAVSAIPLDNYGWLQIFGRAIVKVTAGSANVPVYSTGTAGTLSSSVTATALINGAAFSSAIGTPAAGQAYIQLTYPSMVALG